MGIKSRGNFSIPLCLKFNCKNRGKSCKECIRFSNYKTLVGELYEEFRKSKEKNESNKKEI